MIELGVDPPDPARPSSSIEFVAALRELRVWSGLTFRQLAAKIRASGEHLPVSTIASALSRSSLPRRDVVAGLARACGLDQESVAAWVGARDALLARTGQPVAPEIPSPPQEADPGIRAWSAPCMLPPDIADFTGRYGQVTLLRDLLTPRPPLPDPAPVVIAAVCGMGGVGKSALALHAAHLLVESYPDGQLWVDLRDAEAGPLDPDDVLARFLRALGVDSRAIPADPAERAETYRTRLAGRRVLVILDNASSERQVRPLLPGAATCAVLITSRLRLTGIEGAHHLDLEMFTADEALRLLARIADDDRIGTQADEAAEIVELCGGLPLAVRIAGARLAARPAWRLAHLVALLGDERRRLDRLSTGDLAVRASLALSYRELDEVPRRLLHLLALFDVPDFPSWLAAAVLECPLEQAVEYVESLVDAQLLAVAGTDVAGQVRYHFHDLVRLFALERATAEESQESIAGTLIRGFGGWVALAERLAPTIPGPCYALIGSPVPRPAIDWTPNRILHGTPVHWFDAERAALISGVRQACRLGLDDLAFDLAGCLEKYFDLRGMYADWAGLNAEVMALCRDTGNLLGEAVMLRGLLDVTTWITDGHDGEAMARLRAGAFRLLEMFTELGHERGISDAAVMCSWALTAAGCHVEAVAMATRALEIAARCGHLGGEARAYLVLAVANFDRERFEAAAAHAASALRTARRLGNPRWEATALQFCGIGLRELGDLDASRRLLDESLAISRLHEDHYTEVLTLLALARLHLRRGDPQAREVAEDSLALSREYRMVHHMAEAFELLGEIELAGGRPDRAVAYLERSVTLWRTRGWHSLQAAALTSLGRAYLGIDPQAAREAFREARSLFLRLGNTAKVAELEPLTRGAIADVPGGTRRPAPRES